MKKQISKCVKMLFLGIIMCLGMALSVHAEGSGQFFQFERRKVEQGRIFLDRQSGTDLVCP
ncbi:MAG: hypothetical protein ACLTER_23680 [Ruminococcus sp.]